MKILELTKDSLRLQIKTNEMEVLELLNGQPHSGRENRVNKITRLLREIVIQQESIKLLTNIEEVEEAHENAE